MIELKPILYNNVFCPECKSKVDISIQDVFIPGMHTYADCTCGYCGFQFYQMLPVGHFVNAPLAIGKYYSHVYNNTQDCQWLVDVVLQLFPANEDDVKIEKIVYREYNKVIILNTLDFLYGHALLKLYNAAYHLEHDETLGLILIIPKMFEWMIPKGCAEVWIVDLKLNDFRRGYKSISQFIAKEFSRYDKIYLSKAYSHPNFKPGQIVRFTGIEPFRLDDFYKNSPNITFVLREDRWWFKNVFDYVIYRIGRKFGLQNYTRKILTIRQNRLVKDTIRQIRSKCPLIEFNIVGLGRTGNFDVYADDKRSDYIDSTVEKTWCKIYSRTHVVIGFHGSNMLLPTAFAAGCVEILPEDRYGNMVQDLSVRYVDRLQLFFYRFADQYATPKSIAKKALSIINDYKYYQLNMCNNVYSDSVMEIKLFDDRHHS